MEDHNQQEFNDPIQPQEFSDPIQSNDSANSEEMNTYWETDINTQKQFSAEPSQKSSNNPMPETPEEFYEYYQKKMSDQTPIQPIAYPTEPVRKNKSSGKIFAAVITILILIGAGTVAFAFRSTLLNTFALLTKNPVNYYSSIEKGNLNTTTNLIKHIKTNQNIAQHTSAEFTLNRNSVDNLLKKYSQTGLSDIENELGISLKSFGLDAYVVKQDKLLYEKLGLSLNKTNVISAEAYLDNDNVKFRLPQLSSAYIKISQSDKTADISKLFSSKLTDSNDIADFLNRYGTIVIDHVKHVRINKNTKLTQGDISVNCSKLTVTITSADQKNMEAAILKSAKSDDYIIDMLPSFDTTKEEYIKSIDKLLADLKDGNIKSDQKDIKMDVYVDRNGKIIGRDIEVNKNGEYGKAFSYSLLDKNNKSYISINLYDDKDKDALNITGNIVKKNDAYDGSLTINSASSDIPTAVSLNVDFKDCRIEYKNNMLSTNGTFTITTPSMKNMKYTMDFDSSDDVQKCKMAITNGGSSVVTIDTKTEQLKGYAIPAISETDKVYDSKDASSYLKTIDTKKYINDLSKKLGLKKKILNNLLANID